jgi:nicotinate-nucleotide adenylyltransferase
MRLGIFGGTFDPVHIGHLVIAQVALEEAELDQVLFVPAGVNPLKVGSKTTDGRHRLEMVRLAIADHPQFAVTDWELRQTGPSYTVHTLEYIRSRHPDDELFFIIGADNLHLLPKWRSAERIAELATILALTRPRYDLGAGKELAQTLSPTLAAQVRCIDIPGLDVSSTWLRERFVKNRSVKHLLPDQVIGYCKENKLYE